MKQLVIMITTGGTIEKTYDEDDGQLINRKSIVQEKILPKLRLPFTEVDVRQVLAKDSLFMDDRDREMLAKVINQYMGEGAPVVVLHGTDTMDKTLKFCQEFIPDPKVAVVFTGAMRPVGYEDSDALQNITESLIVAQTASPGFYLAFHGQLFKGPTFKKDRNLRTFRSNT